MWAITRRINSSKPRLTMSIFNKDYTFNYYELVKLVTEKPMKKELPHFKFRHDQFGHVNTPFTIWADPHNFNSNLWTIIKDTEKQIADYVQQTKPTRYDISKIYLSLRSTTRSILLKYKAQGRAPSLRLNTGHLLRELEAKPIKERFGAISRDIDTLRKFHHIYEVIQILRDWEPIKISTTK